MATVTDAEIEAAQKVIAAYVGRHGLDGVLSMVGDACEARAEEEGDESWRDAADLVYECSDESIVEAVSPAVGEEDSAPVHVPASAPGQSNQKALAIAEDLQRKIDQQAGERVAEMVRDLYEALGWQGGTIHQVKEEIARLRRAESAARAAARMAFCSFRIHPDDNRVGLLRNVLREFNDGTGPTT